MSHVQSDKRRWETSIRFCTCGSMSRPVMARLALLHRIRKLHGKQSNNAGLLLGIQTRACVRYRN